MLSRCKRIRVKQHQKYPAGTPTSSSTTTPRIPGGGGGPQWVRFASPQLAPTAPATAVFGALGSVFQISVFAFRVFNGWGQGQSPFLPFPQYQVSCRMWCCGSANIRPGTRRMPGRSAFGPFLYRVQGVYAGQVSTVGGHLLLLAALGHAVPCVVFGPWPPGGGGGLPLSTGLIHPHQQQTPSTHTTQPHPDMHLPGTHTVLFSWVEDRVVLQQPLQWWPLRTGKEAVLVPADASSPGDKNVQPANLHPMVRVLVNFDVPKPNYGHFGRLAGHGRATIFGAKKLFLSSKLKNCKILCFSAQTVGTKNFFGRSGAMNSSPKAKAKAYPWGQI